VPFVISTSRARETLGATALFAALTLIFTWPLALGLTRDIPGDFGDPLLNAWILAWDATHLGRGWWNANIFFPHPLSLAYSEHLLPQALEILPIYAATKQAILCYNLLFLSTFVLSGVGMFLFAREITGRADAAVVAGIAYAFAPYRVPSMPHLQVLSSAWMPFALLGFRRHFTSGRMQPLLWGSLAWLAQNLSSGYYLLFFSPVVAMYLAWEMATRSLWRDVRTAARVVASCAAVAALSVPFLLPYIELRRLGFGPRSLEETTQFSADVFAYLTADPNARLWGPILQLWPQAEGALFPGFTIVALAAVAVARRRERPQKGVRPVFSEKGVRPLFLRAILGGLVGCAIVLVAMLGGWTLRRPIKIASIGRVAFIASILLALALVIFSDARAAARRWLGSPAGLFALVLLFAIVMSWGPSIRSRGRPIASTTIYTAFYRFVPGFDGIRAPARFAMIAAFALAVLAGLGIAAIDRRRRARSIAIAASIAIVIESIAIPIPINQNSTEYGQPGLAPLPPSIAASMPPPIYSFVATLSPSAAIIELPLGEPAFDVRYMFYSTVHWRRLVNGYSGGSPAEYGLLDQTLRDALIRSDRAWQALTETRATHAIVHEASYTGDRGARMSAWLRSHEAREMAAFGPDRIFRIP
jgi:hypothetical protein